MKKILFVINNLNMGGIQTSLLELLRKLTDKYDITLFCIRDDGVLRDDLPDRVKLTEADMPLRLSELTRREAKKCGAMNYLLFLFCTIWSKLFTRKFIAYFLTRYCQKEIGIFDVAVSFTQPIRSDKFFNLSNEVVLYSCRASKKITFVHCDFLAYGGNDLCNQKMYEHFDIVAAVSDSVGVKLAQAIPVIKDRITTVFNCFDMPAIISKACEDTVEYSEKYPIVSVCRCTKEKGLARCVEIMANLISAGYDIKWHIVGDGEEVPTIERLASEYSVQSNIIMHGMQKNPYRYMKNAKLLFMPSFHEAAPMVFNEARCLNLPVLTTNTTSANEMIFDTECGWVVGNTASEIQNGLVRALGEIKRGYRTKGIDESFSDRGAQQFISLVESK